MKELLEGNLKLSVPKEIVARKFDDALHGLTHCMKAVDFILDLQDRYIFIELKDPENPNSRRANSEKFVDKFISGSIDKD